MEQVKYTVKLNQWFRFIKNKYENIYLLLHYHALISSSSASFQTYQKFIENAVEN